MSGRVVSADKTRAEGEQNVKVITYLKLTTIQFVSSKRNHQEESSDLYTTEMNDPLG